MFNAVGSAGTHFIACQYATNYHTTTLFARMLSIHFASLMKGRLGDNESFIYMPQPP